MHIDLLVRFERKVGGKPFLYTSRVGVVWLQLGVE
jgi:hypothetical protein